MASRKESACRTGRSDRSPRRIALNGRDAGAIHLTGPSATYTLNADFDEGTSINVGHPVPDQLQLDDVATPFNFIWVAASARGTIVKIDTTTGAILAEYWSAPDGRGRNPSRTTVEANGGVWAGNRDEFSGGKGSVVHIGLPENGGCVDRNGNSVIETSTGLGDIKPWLNGGGVDDNGGVTTAADECIIHYTRVTGTGTRTVAVDANNDVWTGGVDTDHELVDGVTGVPVGGTQINYGCGGYGGLVHPANGYLFSARFGANLLVYDPADANPATCLDTTHGDYGLGLDPVTGHVWHTNLSGNLVRELDSAGNLLNSYAHGNENAQGVAVDGAGNVWVAHSLFGATTVGHLRTDGTYVGNVALPGGNGPTGVAVDAAGKVWVTNINTNNAMRIDPSAGPIGGGGFPIGAVDLTVDLGVGAGPYNYSDMTGSTIIAPPTQGTWEVIHDSGTPGSDWSSLSWNSLEPGDSSISVAVAASDSLVFGPSTPAANGGDPAVVGQYIKVTVTFVRSSTDSDGDGFNDSPILYDLTVSSNEAPDCSAAAASQALLWPPNHQFVPISIIGVTDPDGDPITITIDSIFQDEPVNTASDGDTSPDGQGVGTSTAEVRAERAGSPKVPGDGRVYHIGFTADDGNGGTCEGTVSVGVPHDQGGNAVPIDGGPLYDSTLP